MGATSATILAFSRAGAVNPERAPHGPWLPVPEPVSQPHVARVGLEVPWPRCAPAAEVPVEGLPLVGGQAAGGKVGANPRVHRLGRCALHFVRGSAGFRAGGVQDWMLW